MIFLINCSVALYKRGPLRSRLFSEFSNESTGVKGYNKTGRRKMLIVHMEKILHSKNCRTVNPIAQKGCEIFISKYFKTCMHKALNN